MKYDLAIVGLGAVGMGALWAAASRGASVVGFEQFELGHDRGSSHGLSRLFRGAASEGQEYTDLALRSLQIWRDLGRDAGKEIVTLTSGLTIAPQGEDVIRETCSVLDGHGMSYELLDAEQIRGRYPQHFIRDEDVAVLDPASGVVRPELAITVAATAATAAGAEIRTRIRVTAVESVAGGVEVVLDGKERVHAKKVVIAAGPWHEQLRETWPVPLATKRALLTWFHPHPGSEEKFHTDHFPVFRRFLNGEVGWGAGSIDERGVKVGLRDQDGYFIKEPSMNRPDAEPWEVERVETFVQHQFPELIPHARHATGCMITLTPDEKFVIDALPGEPDVLLVAACSGHGFKTSAAVGELSVTLALDLDHALDPQPFALSRFGPGGIGEVHA